MIKMQLEFSGEVNYENPNVWEQKNLLGDFVYNEFTYEKTLGRRELRDGQILENGAKYCGEWLQGTETR
jgi:hypothetical protein